MHMMHETDYESNESTGERGNVEENEMELVLGMLSGREDESCSRDIY